MPENNDTNNTAIILSIKRLKAKGLTIREIAARHGISESEVRAILKGNHPPP